MKNFYTLLLSLLVSTLMMGQASYYILPALDIGENPGGLNTEDAEYPLGSGLPAGWATVMAGTTTDQWSAAQTIPFSFQFDGNAVSQYYVSNNGIVTFNANPGTPPDGNNTSLPSTAIPDMSVMVWGIDISGVGSDNIVSKTFGTAPNRQHWIFYTSATNAGNPNGWTYWSIVLEETTNKIYIVDQRTGSSTGTGSATGLTVGVQVNSLNYAEVNGSPNVSSRAGNDPSAIDNSYYEVIPGSPPNDDMAGIEIDVPVVVLTGKSVFMSGLFRNVGVNTVTSASFNYRINGGQTVTANATGNLPASSGEFKTISSPTQWTPSADGKYEVEMWLSNVNGNADPNNNNDTIKATIIASSNPPERTVVIEERTGTWCGWCPRGTVAMQHMVLNYHETAVLLAVHNSDPMAISEYDSKMSGAFPTFSGDRLFSGQGISGAPSSAGSMISFHDQRRDEIPGATVDITGVMYDPSSGNISVDVSSDFIMEGNGMDLRYALVFTEDGVTGTSSGYAQVNYYAGGAQGPMVDANGFDYSTAPDPVPASQMRYDHVVVGVVPAYEGAAGSVPANISFQQNVTYTFSTSLPARVLNANHVYVNVLLLDQNNGGIVVNAAHKKLTNVVDLEETELLEATVFPNPARDFFQVELAENADFSLELVNAVGQVVLKENYTDRNQVFISTSDLATGMYILNLRTAEGKYSSLNVAVTR